MPQNARVELISRDKPSADVVPLERVRSPLRYPGGKSRAVSAILETIPNGITALTSPFFGGGSIELALVNRGVRVHGL